ncbi:MAG: nicotinamide mononucleotide transporter, partial [Eggerthellaceae bacterium]|nr:nicotinamide mononucleotide transporter [Eggerthellaceae bacterium]
MKSESAGVLEASTENAHIGVLSKIKSGWKAFKEAIVRQQWKPYEVIFFALFGVSAIVASVVTGDTLVGFVSGFTGIVFVMLTARGIWWAFPIGIIQCLTYAVGAYANGLFGEFFINLFFYIPVNTVAFFKWRKNTAPEAKAVSMKRFTVW